MAETTFGGSPKTVNGKFDMPSDHKMPALGALSLGSMTSPTALAGTDGADTKLVHGDRWQQIVGNETDFITINQSRTIEGNESRMLTGNLDTTVHGTTKDDRFDVYLHNFFAQSTFNYFHHRVENHTAAEQEHQPTEHMEVIANEEKKKDWSFETTLHKQEGIGLFIGGTGIKVEALGTVAEGFIAKGALGGIEVTGMVWKNRAEAIETRINAFAAKYTGAEVEAGGPDTSIRPIFVGILVAVHIDSPFA